MTSSRYSCNKITFALRRERRCNKKELFLPGRFWSRARKQDLLTDQISFEWLTVNGYGKILDGVSFVTESEQNQKKATLCTCKQVASSPSALVMQNSCVKFFLNFMFTNC